MEKALTHTDNVYRIPNMTIEGRVCYTNLTPNTAFRGFGATQGMMTMEHVMDRVATHLELPPETVREINMYKEGDSTPWGQVLSNCTIRRCWSQLKETSFFVSRKDAVKKFNRFVNL